MHGFLAEFDERFKARVSPRRAIRRIFFVHPALSSPMIPSPISRDTASHYVWGAACDGWHLLQAQALSVIEERMPAAAEEVRHWHARARQFFYVLQGTLELEVEGEVHQIRAGEGIELPPGVAHQARNRSADDVRFLVVSQPPSHGDRMTEDSVTIS